MTPSPRCRIGQPHSTRTLSQEGRIGLPPRDPSPGCGTRHLPRTSLSRDPSPRCGTGHRSQDTLPRTRVRTPTPGPPPRDVGQNSLPRPPLPRTRDRTPTPGLSPQDAGQDSLEGPRPRTRPRRCQAGRAGGAGRKPRQAARLPRPVPARHPASLRPAPPAALTAIFFCTILSIFLAMRITSSSMAPAGLPRARPCGTGSTRSWRAAGESRRLRGASAGRAQALPHLPSPRRRQRRRQQRRRRSSPAGRANRTARAPSRRHQSTETSWATGPTGRRSSPAVVKVGGLRRGDSLARPAAPPPLPHRGSLVLRSP